MEAVSSTIGIWKLATISFSHVLTLLQCGGSWFRTFMDSTSLQTGLLLWNSYPSLRYIVCHSSLLDTPSKLQFTQYGGRGMLESMVRLCPRRESTSSSSTRLSETEFCHYKGTMPGLWRCISNMDWSCPNLIHLCEL